MKWIVLLVGVAGVLLGGLWLLQGLRIVNIRPVLCVAECAPLDGPSARWAIIGLGALAAGSFAIRFALKRRGHASD